MTVMWRVFGALAAALGLLVSAPRPTAARPCAPQPWDTRIGQSLTVTPLAGGDLLVLFGINSLPRAPKRPFASARYELASGCFRPMKQMPLDVGYGQAAIALTDARVLVAGGERRVSCDELGLVPPTDIISGIRGVCVVASAATAILDPVLKRWQVGRDMPIARTNGQMVLLHDGRVLVVGGHGTNFNATLFPVLFDPATETWRPLLDGKLGHGVVAVVLRNGNVWISDGTNASVLVPGDRAGAARFAPAAPPRVARELFTATVLSDGRLLLTGGFRGAASLADVEIWDPERDAWSTTGSLNDARAMHAAALLPDGRVAVIGGTQGDAQETIETWDPRTGKWIRTGKLRQPRTWFQMVALPGAGGRFALFGGRGLASAARLPSPEIVSIP
jgi:hypothetical protein